MKGDRLLVTGSTGESFIMILVIDGRWNKQSADEHRHDHSEYNMGCKYLRLSLSPSTSISNFKEPIFIF